MAKKKNNRTQLSQRRWLVLAAFIAVGAGILCYDMLRPDAYTLQGDKLSWRNAEGQWRLVNFFAPWCAPCLREIPALNTLNARVTNKVKIYGVSFDPKTASELTTLVDNLDIQFDVIVVDDATVFPMPYPKYLPATYLISPQGKVAASLFGEQTEQTVADALAKQGIRLPPN